MSREMYGRKKHYIKKQGGNDFVYVLELYGGFFYIGKTHNVMKRLKEHFEGSGTVMTRMYRPRRVIEVIPGCDAFDERYHTLRYMRLHGWKKVRGYIWSQIKPNQPVELKYGEHDCQLCSKPHESMYDLEVNHMKKEHAKEVH